MWGWLHSVSGWFGRIADRAGVSYERFEAMRRERDYYLHLTRDWRHTADMQRTRADLLVADLREKDRELEEMRFHVCSINSALGIGEADDTLTVVRHVLEDRDKAIQRANLHASAEAALRRKLGVCHRRINELELRQV